MRPSWGSSTQSAFTRMGLKLKRDKQRDIPDMFAFGPIGECSDRIGAMPNKLVPIS